MRGDWGHERCHGWETGDWGGGGRALSCDDLTYEELINNRRPIQLHALESIVFRCLRGPNPSQGQSIISNRGIKNAIYNIRVLKYNQLIHYVRSAAQVQTSTVK